MKLRQALGGDARRIHEVVDQLLDGEDSLILLVDGAAGDQLRRRIRFITMSTRTRDDRARAGSEGRGGTCHQEEGEEETRSEQVDDPGNRARVREHVGSDGGRPTAVWLTDEVRVVALVMLPTAIVASLLVLYFDWRAELQRRLLAERDDGRGLGGSGLGENHASHEYNHV